MKKTVTEMGPNLTIEETDTYIKYHTGDGTITHHKSKNSFMMKWIDVTDRLPEPEQWVIVSRNGDIMLFMYQFLHNKWYGYGYPHPDTDITHWMPLPNIPKIKK